MKSKKSVLLLTLIITFTFMSFQFYQPVFKTSGQTTDDISVIRLVLNSPTLSFSQNDSAFIFMSIENIANETLYDVTFNFTAKENLYKIEDSTNTSQTSEEFVFYKRDKLENGERFTFNTTLKILSNTSNSVETIDSLRIDYRFGEFKIFAFTEAPELEIFLFNPTVDEKDLKPKISGYLDSDAFFFLFFFVFPVVLGLLLSFLFGRRQKKL